MHSGGMLNYSSIALSLGEYAAPMGTGAALVLLACGLFLWSQKDCLLYTSWWMMTPISVSCCACT